MGSPTDNWTGAEARLIPSLIYLHAVGSSESMDLVADVSSCLHVRHVQDSFDAMISSKIRRGQKNPIIFNLTQKQHRFEQKGQNVDRTRDLEIIAA